VKVIKINVLRGVQPKRHVLMTETFVRFAGVCVAVCSPATVETGQPVGKSVLPSADSLRHEMERIGWLSDLIPDPPKDGL
jgi:hypothetical protein